MLARTQKQKRPPLSIAVGNPVDHLLNLIELYAGLFEHLLLRLTRSAGHEPTRARATPPHWFCGPSCGSRGVPVPGTARICWKLSAMAAERARTPPPLCHNTDRCTPR